MAIAPATPAIFPVPTVPASAVQTAWKGVREPSDASFFLKILPSVVLSALREFADLDKTGPQAQVKPYADNTDHSRDTPDKIIYDVIDGFNCLKHVK